jgi:glycosyltransferase involved in cell wall biosynthesis
MTEKKFSLAVVLSGGQQTGGGFHQALTNLRMLLKALPEEFSVTVVDSRGSFSKELGELEAQGLMGRATVITVPKRLSSFRDRVLTDGPLVFRIARALLRLSGVEVSTSVLARFLDNSTADLVYFTSPAPEAAELMIKPFVWTLWDLCHLDSPEFPEVRTSGKFEARDDVNARALRKAALVGVDSSELIDNVETYFGAGRGKFISIPFAPPVSRHVVSTSSVDLPAEVSDLAGKYFFYPAQLWTHKNHLRIVEALREVNSESYDLHAVFVGKDHGAGSSIRHSVSELGMNSHVHFLGYVEDTAIPALYTHSLGLIMASYFGPTNIPPLEAMLLKTPVIASDVHRNQLGDAALYFDPDDSGALSHLMIDIGDSETRKRLVKAGQKRLTELDALRKAGEQSLVSGLVSLSKRILRPHS